MVRIPETARALDQICRGMKDKPGGGESSDIGPLCVQLQAAPFPYPCSLPNWEQYPGVSFSIMAPCVLGLSVSLFLGFSPLCPSFPQSLSLPLVSQHLFLPSDPPHSQ